MFHHSKRIHFMMVFCVLAGWLMACQSNQRQEGAAMTLEPTAAAPTTSPTNTPIPPTPLPTATPLPEPTTALLVEATPTNIPITTKSADNVFYEQEWLSPDGQWRAYSLLTFVSEDGNVTGYQTDLIVSQVEGALSWDVYSTVQGAGLGVEVPTVLVWSTDGQSLFFTLQAIADGCPGYLTRFYSGLHQLDLTSGEVVELDFGGIPSPDGTMVAQMGWDPAAAILVHHLDTNTTTTYTWETPLERDNVARNMRLVWSPDSRAIALEYATGFCFQIDLYSLLYLDLTTGEQRILIQQEGQALAIADWSTPDEIYLREGESNEPVEVVNVETGERTPLE